MLKRVLLLGGPWWQKKCVESKCFVPIKPGIIPSNPRSSLELEPPSFLKL